MHTVMSCILILILQIIVNIPFNWAYRKKEESSQLMNCFAVVGDSNIQGQGDRQINSLSDINHIWSHLFDLIKFVE